MAGDTSTVFVCETNEDTKSWAYFGAKKHLSELLKWFDPKKYESEALLTRRVRMLKDAHENNLVPSHSETCQICQTRFRSDSIMRSKLSFQRH